MTAPCKACPDRHELCHMTCERYLAYKAERDRLRADRQAALTVLSNEARKRAVRKKLNRYKRDH